MSHPDALLPTTTGGTVASNNERDGDAPAAATSPAAEAGPGPNGAAFLSQLPVVAQAMHGAAADDEALPQAVALPCAGPASLVPPSQHHHHYHPQQQHHHQQQQQVQHQRQAVVAVVRNLRAQLEAQQEQLRQQEAKTGMLAVMLEAQRQFNEDQIRVNRIALMAGEGGGSGGRRRRRSSRGSRSSSSSSSSSRSAASSGATSSSARSRSRSRSSKSSSSKSSSSSSSSSRNSGRGPTAAAGGGGDRRRGFPPSSISASSSMSERGGSLSSSTRAAASVPTSAARAVESAMRPFLLAREKEVTRVVESLSRGLMFEKDYGDQTPTEKEQDSIEFPCPDIFHPSRLHTVLSGPAGSGKTTLAAMAASHTDVLSCFTDGVGWVSCSQSTSSLEFDEYAECLRDLCGQLDVPVPRSLERSPPPADPTKKRRAMDAARQEMVNALSGKCVLVVLDDLWRLDDADWFAFGRSPASAFRLLVTTRLSAPAAERRDAAEAEAMTSVGTAIALGCLGEEEAVRMLLAKAGASSEDAFLAPGDDSRKKLLDAAAVVARKCDYLPLALKFARRQISGRSSSAAMSLTIEELAAIMSSEHEDGAWGGASRVGDVQGEPLNGSVNGPTFLSSDDSSIMHEVLGRSLSPSFHGDIAARAMKVCFVAFATTFSHPTCERPFVPLAVVCSFWDRLLSREEHAVLQNKCHQEPTKSSEASLAYLLDEMEALGLMHSEEVEIPVGRTRPSSRGNDVRSPSNTKSTVSCRLKHDLLRHYALYVLHNDDDLGYKSMARRLRLNGGSKVRTIAAKCREKLRGKKSVRDKGEQDSACVIQLLQFSVAENSGITKRDKVQKDLGALLSNDGYMFKHLPSTCRSF